MVYDPDGNLVSGPAVQLAEADLKYAPYIGSGWITGTASGLGEVYIYVPISSRGSWGLLLMAISAMLAVILYQVFCILKLAPDTRFLAALLLSLVIVSLIVQAIRILTCIYL